MEKTGRQALVLLSFLIVRLSSTNVNVAYPWTKVSAIIAFGDSDARTNNLIEGLTRLADLLSYGGTFFHRATGRLANGHLALDVIARPGLPIVPPSLKAGVTFEKCVNLASAGNGVLSTTSLGDVTQFHQVATKLTSDLGTEADGNLISNPMHFSPTGSNDLSAFSRNSTLQQIVSPAKFVTSVLSEVRGHFQTMYYAGARKVLVFGVGRLGCAPQDMAAANGTNEICVDAPNRRAQNYKAALRQLMDGLNAELLNVCAVIVNPVDIGEGFLSMEMVKVSPKVQLLAAGMDLSTPLCIADPTIPRLFVTTFCLLGY